MENTTISKIDPKEFGLEDNQAKSIESAFMPKIVERDGLKTIYEQILTKEITPSLCLEAKVLRLKLVKVRTGISEIHKTQKAFFLAAGRYVDAWRTKETLPGIQMEDTLEAIEKHFERIEAEMIKNLQIERAYEMQKYEASFIPSNLGALTDEVWANFILGTRVAFEQKELAKKAALEAEQKELAMGDVDKIADLITSLRVLKTKYTFKSAKYKKIYSDVNILLDKVITHIEK